MATEAAQRVHISLIVPAFNEEARIGKSLDRILDFIRSQRHSFEVIIADDGSRDGTVELVRDRFGRHLNVKILSQARNQGKGEAVKQGMLSASGDYLFFTDADLSVPIETLPTFLARLENHCDVIIGTRKKAGALIEVHQPFYREFMGKTYTMLSNWILASHISDFTCGFKGFRKEAARVLFSLQRLKDWSFDSEILYLAQLKGYRIEEIPVTWRDDHATKVKLWRDVALSFLSLMKIRANQYLRRYD
jgi:dolichyl-phosphate beta-glucosyltransferase